MSTIKNLYDPELDKLFDVFVKDVFKKNPESVLKFLIESFIDDIYTGQDFLIHYTEMTPEQIDPIMESWKTKLQEEKRRDS
jgi:hypothetical protein